ncbi:chitin synthase-like [Mya arenaria]|uniref:chitin synthase-like n=1 Tax=Mya arenaria TaxID=6604 RepID=UPI0022E83B7D|nr:chitin synthase-like [Mya arenaria]
MVFVKDKNKRIGTIFWLYEVLTLVSTVVGPSSVILVVSGGLVYAWGVSTTWSTIIQILLIVIYAVVSLRASQTTQMIMANFLTYLYSVTICAVMVGILIEVVQDVIGTNTDVIDRRFCLSTSTLYLFIMVGLFLLTGIMHLWKEFRYLLYGFCYFLAIPAGYLVLMVYSLCNITDRSWGTRESATKNNGSNKTENESSCSGMLQELCRCPCVLQTRTEREIIKVVDGVSQTDPAELSDNSLRSQQSPISPSSQDSQEAQGSQQSPSSQDSQEAQGSQQSPSSQDSQEAQGSQQSPSSQDSQEAQGSQQSPISPSSQDSQEAQGSQQSPISPSSQDSQEAQGSQQSQSSSNSQKGTPENESSCSGMLQKLCRWPCVWRTRTERETIKLVDGEFRPDSAELSANSLRSQQSPISPSSQDSQEAQGPQESPSSQETLDFWKDLQPRIQPEKDTSNIQGNLVSLRNTWLLLFSISNSLWMILIITMANNAQLLKVVGSNPIGLFVLTIFLIVLTLQFLAMLRHRIGTFVHFIARKNRALDGSTTRKNKTPHDSIV